MSQHTKTHGPKAPNDPRAPGSKDWLQESLEIQQDFGSSWSGTWLPIPESPHTHGFPTFGNGAFVKAMSKDPTDTPSGEKRMHDYSSTSTNASSLILRIEKLEHELRLSDAGKSAKNASSFLKEVFAIQKAILTILQAAQSSGRAGSGGGFTPTASLSGDTPTQHSYEHSDPWGSPLTISGNSLLPSFGSVD